MRGSLGMRLTITKVLLSISPVPPRADLAHEAGQGHAQGLGPHITGDDVLVPLSSPRCGPQNGAHLLTDHTSCK